MTETWLKTGIPNGLISSFEYNVLRYDRTITNFVTGVCKSGGGIVVYLKKGIIYETLESVSVCNSDIEMFVVKITPYGNKKQILIVVYRPPSGNTANAINALTSCVNTFYDKYNNSEYVIMGDMNINYLNKRCCYVKLLKGFEKQFGLSQVIKDPTRFMPTNETLIDLRLTNMKNQAGSGVVPYFLSDHFPIYIVKKKQKSESKSCAFTGRCYTNYSLEVFEALINQINWSDIGREENPNLMWGLITLELLKIADLICPTKEFFVTKKRPIYFTEELVEYIKERDTVLSLAVCKKDVNYWKRGLELRKKVMGFIKEAKRSYIVNKLETHKKDSKKYWKAVQLVLPNARSTGIEVIFDPVKNEIVDGQAAANVINYYFANIGENLAKVLPASNSEYWRNSTQTEFIWEYCISPHDILYYAKDFCPSKSSGITNFSSRFLLDFFVLKPVIMADLFNKCIKTGIYPDCWKQSIMVPIPKNSNPLYLNNLRPISLLPLPGKLFEKIIHTRLSNYFENNNLFCENQGGFRRGMDTTHTIYELSDYVNTGFNFKNNFCLAAFADLAKAFDSLERSLL